MSEQNEQQLTWHDPSRCTVAPAKHKKLVGNMKSIAERLKPRTYARRIAVAHVQLAWMELGTRRLGGAWHNNQLDVAGSSVDMRT